MGEQIALTSTLLDVVERPFYLHVVQTGAPCNQSEIEQYRAALARISYGARRALFDMRVARLEEVEVSELVWRTLLVSAFDALGIVPSTTMDVARLNMDALSQRSSARAFELMTDAHRWLTRERSSTLPPALRPSLQTDPRSPSGSSFPARPALRSSEVQLRAGAVRQSLPRPARVPKF
jgi:hypothetical protein